MKLTLFKNLNLPFYIGMNQEPEHKETKENILQVQNQKNQEQENCNIPNQQIENQNEQIENPNQDFQNPNQDFQNPNQDFQTQQSENPNQKCPNRMTANFLDLDTQELEKYNPDLDKSQFNMNVTNIGGNYDEQKENEQKENNNNKTNLGGSLHQIEFQEIEQNKTNIGAENLNMTKIDTTRIGVSFQEENENEKDKTNLGINCQNDYGNDILNLTNLGENPTPGFDDNNGLLKEIMQNSQELKAQIQENKQNQYTQKNEIKPKTQENEIKPKTQENKQNQDAQKNKQNQDAQKNKQNQDAQKNKQNNSFLPPVSLTPNIQGPYFKTEQQNFTPPVQQTIIVKSSQETKDNDNINQTQKNNNQNISEASNVANVVQKVFIGTTVISGVITLIYITQSKDVNKGKFNSLKDMSEEDKKQLLEKNREKFEKYASENPKQLSKIHDSDNFNTLLVPENIWDADTEDFYDNEEN